MIRFLDGPAGGVLLELERAPIFLRVVVDETNGRVDGLDQLDDTPGPSEVVHVYERLPGTYGQPMFACARAAGRSVMIARGDYRYRPDGDGERLRFTDAWREWARSQPHPEAVGV